MQGDRIIDRERAWDIQQAGIARGLLVMWVITQNTTDYPGSVVARPQYIGRSSQEMIMEVLVTDSVEELRLTLPAGLTCLSRHPSDDPVIMETWF